MFGIFFAGGRYAHEYLSNSFVHNAVGETLPAADGSELSTVLARTPSNAEVISSVDISGRFSARQYAYVYLNGTTSVPIRARTVDLVVVDTPNLTRVSVAHQRAAVNYVVSRFRARTLFHRNGVWELGWSASSTNSSIEIP
jgi:hypothetical protein